MSFIDLAQEVESKVNSQYGFDDVGKAKLVGVSQGVSGVEFTKPCSHADIYELLEMPATLKLAKASLVVAVITTGWAAPLENGSESDVPPSQHPEKRRVRLVVIANRQEVISVLRFQDNPTETVVDEGRARGSLADAVKALLKKSASKR